MENIKTGRHEMTNEEYHSSPGISKSGLDMIDKNPAAYKWRYIDGNIEPPTQAMVTGSATHKLVLEPDDFDSEFAVAPEINRRTKAGKAAWAEFCDVNADKQVISADDHARIKRIADAVHSHPVARSILESYGGEAEVSVFGRHEPTGELVKVRSDWLIEDVIADLKTTDDASAGAFSRSCARFRYHLQAAMYLRVVSESLSRFMSDFVFIVVEKSEPHFVAVYRADDEMMAAGEIEYDRLMSVYHECMTSGIWPEYNDGRIVDISLPRWTAKRIFGGGIYE